MRPLLHFLFCLAWLLALELAESYDLDRAAESFQFDGYQTARNLNSLLKAKSEPRTERPSLSITSVLDISKSMATLEIERKSENGTDSRNLSWLDYLKLANVETVEHLARQGRNHVFGSVVFSNKSRELTRLLRVGDSSKDAKDAINGLKNGAYARDLCSGLVLGIEQQRTQSNETHLRNMLLFTHSLSTADPSLTECDIHDILKRVMAMAPDIRIHIIASGDDIDHDMLKKIARLGNGVFKYVHNAEDIPSAYASILEGLFYLFEFRVSQSYRFDVCCGERCRA